MLKSRWLLLASLLFNVLFVVGAGALLYKRGGLSSLQRRTPSTDNGYFRERRDVFLSLPRREGAIIFLGDSLIERCRWSELLGRHDILNRGAGLETLLNISERLDEVVRHRPRQLFVMAGINDVILGRDVASIVADEKALVAQVRKASPRTVIVLQSLLPVNRVNLRSYAPDIARRMEASRNASVVEINRALSQMADGKSILYLNIHDRLLDKSRQLSLAYTLDGLHLNGAGYAQWAQALRPLLKP